MNKQKFSQYGIDFRLVHSEEDVELLRRTRNMPNVRQYMFNQEEISPEHHKNWFQLLDREKNFYFIYSLDLVDIGVVNITKVDYSAGICEAGVYVANDDYLNSHLNIGALLFLYKYAFDTLNLNSIQARILPTNVKAIRMNLSLGFQLVDINANLYILTRDGYLGSVRKYERIFTR